MTTLAVEELASILDSPDWAWVSRLLDAHWNEVVHNKKLLKLMPDLKRYRDLEAKDLLHVVILRNDDGKVGGYSVHFIVRGHPHYKQLTAAEDNIHYLVPELRGTGKHEEMRRFALKTLRQRGVHYVTARMKIGHEHDKTLRRIGYKPVDIVYALDLKNWE